MNHPLFGYAIVGGLLLLGVTECRSAQQQGLGYVGTPQIPGSPYHVHAGDRPQPRIVTPGTNFSLNAMAPSDATVLFDGKDLDQWTNGRGGAPAWAVKDGYVETGRGGGIRTKGKWADFQLHLEFATPTQMRGTGQGRGNSGILINAMYEVQVLDSYTNQTYPDGQAGALYGQTPPLVNASKPPGEWQSYDIIFESPRWEGTNLVKKAAVTVLHNGVVLHHRREYIGGTDGISRDVPHTGLGRYGAPHAPEVFLELQDHNNPVRYRNIWIRQLGEYDKS